MFASTVEHSKAICADFARMGVRVAHLDGTTPEDERRSMLAKLEAGELDIISNVNVAHDGRRYPGDQVHRPRAAHHVAGALDPVDRASAAPLERHPTAHPRPRRQLRAALPAAQRLDLVARPEGRPPPWTRAYEALSEVQRVRGARPVRLPVLRSRLPGADDGRLPKETNETLVELTPAALQRAFYDEQVQKARTRGFKPGYASAKFKEKFGHWPPYGWSEATKSSFASDPVWQQALSIKEAYRSAHEKKTSGPATPSGQVQTGSAPPSPTGTSDSAEDRRPLAESAAEVFVNPMQACISCGGNGGDPMGSCERCFGSCVEPNNDYLSDADDAPFAAWLDEEGIR